MSKLSKLSGRKKTYVIGDVELELKARTLKDLDLIMDLGEESKKNEAMKKLVFATLKEADPEATDEEINAFGMQYFQVLSESVIDVNGLGNVTTNTS